MGVYVAYAPIHSGIAWRSTNSLSGMLKKSASSVLGSSKSSTYPEGTPPVSTRLRPCWTAFLSILRECSPVVPHMPTIEVLLCRNGFPAACEDAETSSQLSFSAQQNPQRSHEATPPVLSSPPASLGSKRVSARQGRAGEKSRLFEHPHLNSL